MMRRKEVLLLVSLFLPVVFLFACQATVSGSKTGQTYTLNRSVTKPYYWETVISKDVKPVYNAVLAGIKDLGLIKRTSKVDRLSGLVEGTFADGTDFRIRISYEAPDRTKVLITAGFTGNKTRSLQIFRAIEKHL
jgi:hypothetical protein